MGDPLLYFGVIIKKRGYGNMENTTIQQVVEDLNNKELIKKEVLNKYNITDSKLRKLLKENGYEYSARKHKWQLSSEVASEDKTKVTYRIPSQLYKALKLQAIFENLNATDIVVKALEQYIPTTTKEIVEQDRK